jgi:hypothetical protein
VESSIPFHCIEACMINPYLVEALTEYWHSADVSRLRLTKPVS